MTHHSLISLPGSSLIPASSLTKTDTSVSCYNGSPVDVPSNDRSLKDESESSTNGCSLEQHESCDGNGFVDSEMWFPPEPEDLEDDIEDSVANYSDNMKGSKPSNLSNLGEEGSGSFRSEKELMWEMLAIKRAEFKYYLEPILKSLGVSGSTSDGGDTWADTITDLSWKAVSFLVGYAVDPNVYVKVKCVATGHRDESEVFEGLAFSKEAAHKHMPPKSIQPKFLLIRGVSYDGLSSFESMKQEKESIDYYMGMIEKLNPNVVLVEKTLSRDIQESIIAKGMTLVLEMKQRLEKVACYTGSPILSSDKVLNEQNLRQFKSLYFEKIEEEHASLCDNGKRPIKTIMFLEGCPTELGLTILLKGSNIHELKKIKKIAWLAVLMAYAWIRQSLFRLREPVNVETVFSNSNKNLMKQNDGITAVLDSGRMPVLISRQNATRETSCLPDIKFHQNIDMPLDIFLLDDLFNQKLLCGTCNELPETHISCYAHRDKKLTVEVKRLPLNEQLRGEKEGKLWMWRYCGKCNGSLKSAKRGLVSVGPHGVSFGKILEHVFSNICGWETPMSCGHFYYRDYLHFYGLGSMVVLFRFSTELTHSVSPSLRKVEFSNSSEGDLLQKEIKKVLEEGCSVFTNVEESLKEMQNELVGSTMNIEGSPIKVRDAQEMLKEERDIFKDEMSDEYVKQLSYKPLYLNHIEWKLSLLSYIWDRRLYSLHILVEPQTSGKKRSCNQKKVKTECGGVGSLKSEDRKRWMWKPFAVLQNIYSQDLQQGYLPTYEPSIYTTTGSIIHRRITQEKSRLHLPLVTEDNTKHMVSDHEGQLSSIIAFALALLSLENQKKLSDVISSQSSLTISSFRSPNWRWLNFLMVPDGSSLCNPSEDLFPFELPKLPNPSTQPHPVISMGRSADTPKYIVACPHHKDFLDFRSRFGLSELDFISSLSRCNSWDAQGGKSKAFFAKTLDDRFVIKEINETEFSYFHDIALAYLAYMNACFQHKEETYLVKILGLYQVQIKKSRETRNLIVMDNITYGQRFNRLYDLKGNLHGRFNPATQGVGRVLLDQNLVDDMDHSPLYIHREAHETLLRAVQNDTCFLRSIGVMDYSMLLGVDAENNKLVCGIIDYLRPYTIDKILENWWKSKVSAPKVKNHSPTIVPPPEYQKRITNFIKHLLTDARVDRRVQEEMRRLHQRAQINYSRATTI